MKKKTTKKEQASMEIADGKLEDVSPETQMQSIDEILGISLSNPFQVKNNEDLNSKIESMSLMDLQKYAVSAGVFPSGTKLALKGKISKAYSSYKRGSGRTVEQSSRPILDPDSTQGKEALRLLGEQ